jgi:hypothetical protein
MATLLQSGNTFTALGGINLAAGTFKLGGGILKDTAVSGSGLFQIDSTSATLDNVTLAGSTLDIRGPEFVHADASISRTLNLSGGTVRTTGTGTSSLRFNSGSSVVGNGQIVFDGSFASVTMPSGFTVGAGVVIRNGAGNGHVNNHGVPNGARRSTMLARSAPPARRAR